MQQPAIRRTSLVPAVPAAVEAAADVLRRDGLVAFPTETVYGLGADATSDMAVAGIYAAKSRPSFNPLIAHMHSAEVAFAEGVFSTEAQRLAATFWPGPLTLVVPLAATSQISQLARAGLDTIALRVPEHPVARALIAAAERPIAAPSANRSGRVSPTIAAHVAADLDGRVDIILDGGACPVGLESTIVACLGDEVRLLRAGGVTREALEAALGRSLQGPAAGPVVAPGMLVTHYAPRAMLRLDATTARAGEAVLDFGGRLVQAGCTAPSYRDLSAAGDLREAAANLFAHLRVLDDTGAAAIACAPIPPHDLGAAITDRLARAAAPR